MKTNNFEFKTRITSQDNGMSKLTITVKHDWDLRCATSWKFTKGIYIIDTPELRAYLKSSDFQEFMSDLSDKYKGMNYQELCELFKREKDNDTQKIEDEMEKYLWTANSKSISENTDDFHFKITKRECLKEGYGIYCGDWFIQGRIYNKDFSKYKTFHYYTSFAPDSVLDLVIDGEEMSDEEIDAIEYKFNNNKSYKKKLFNEYIDFDFERFEYLIKSFDDCEDFYEAIDATIDGYHSKCA